MRTGQVVAEKPAVVTPFYAMNLEGFSEGAYEYFQRTMQRHGPNSPGILYQYRNESEGHGHTEGGAGGDRASASATTWTSGKQELAVVMVSVDEYWDVALLKFIYEFTSSSASPECAGVQEERAAGPASGNERYPESGHAGRSSGSSLKLNPGLLIGQSRTYPEARAGQVGAVRLLRGPLSGDVQAQGTVTEIPGWGESGSQGR